MPQESLKNEKNYNKRHQARAQRKKKKQQPMGNKSFHETLKTLNSSVEFLSD